MVSRSESVTCFVIESHKYGTDFGVLEIHILDAQKMYSEHQAGPTFSRNSMQNRGAKASVCVGWRPSFVLHA